MTTAEATMPNLADLSKLSKELNKKSDEVNQILQDLEKKLADMNLGVEAWVPRCPLSSVQKTLIEEDRWGQPLGERRLSHDEVLGFGRHGDRYMLLVKEVHYRAEPVRPSETEDWQFDSESEPRPLLQASRKLRIEALDMIESLIEALLQEGKRIMGAIEKGRQTVDNL